MAGFLLFALIGLVGWGTARARSSRQSPRPECADVEVVEVGRGIARDGTLVEHLHVEVRRYHAFVLDYRQAIPEVLPMALLCYHPRTLDSTP